MLKCLSAHQPSRTTCVAPFGRFTAIFNKRLVALLFSVLYQRSPESSPPTVALRRLGQLEPQRRWLILDGLVSDFDSAPRRAARATKTCARSI